MKANELRIGNLIMFGELRHECKPCDILNLYQSEIAQREISEYKPIELTEEWLIKFGFIKFEENTAGSIWQTVINGCLFDDIKIVQWYKHNRGFERRLKKIESVHQLQNLYFALTGTELIFKQ